MSILVSLISFSSVSAHYFLTATGEFLNCEGSGLFVLQSCCESWTGEEWAYMLLSYQAIFPSLRLLG